MSSTTVSDGQYIRRDSISISAGCSVDHELQHAKDVGWTAVPTKHKYIERKDLTNEEKVKDSFINCCYSGIELLFLEVT